MAIRRVSESEVRQTGAAGRTAASAPLTGISPVLRANWPFADKMAKKFNKELLQDRVKQFLQSLARKFH